jgi:hypothetical protein
LPTELDLKNFYFFWQMRIIISFFWNIRYSYFEFSKEKLANIYKYMFLYRKEALHTNWKQNFWRFAYFGNYFNYFNSYKFLF